MADVQPTNQQAISDDQELAKVLAGVSAQADNTPLSNDDTVETTPAPELPTNDEPVVSNDVEPSTPVSQPAPAATGDLERIKQDAIVALRPLVDKLELEPEEKFDTYLLLLRSTDDKDLIAPANEAAKAITDESRRAQALLDIIKEIDFLSGPKQ